MAANLRELALHLANHSVDNFKQWMNDVFEDRPSSDITNNKPFGVSRTVNQFSSCSEDEETASDASKQSETGRSDILITARMQKCIQDRQRNDSRMKSQCAHSKIVDKTQAQTDSQEFPACVSGSQVRLRMNNVCVRTPPSGGPLPTASADEVQDSIKNSELDDLQVTGRNLKERFSRLRDSTIANAGYDVVATLKEAKYEESRRMRDLYRVSAGHSKEFTKYTNTELIIVGQFLSQQKSVMQTNNQIISALTTPKMELSIQIFPINKQMRVCLKGAENFDHLCVDDSNICFRMCLMPGKRQRKMSKTTRSCSPCIFNDAIYFHGSSLDELEGQELKLSLVLKHRFLKRDKKIGEAIIPLDSCDFKFDTKIWCKVDDYKR